MRSWSNSYFYLLFFLQDLYLGEYEGVNDNWMGVISSQGSSLLSVDLSGSDITDFGLTYLKDCESLISLNLNYCDQISDRGLECISGNLSFLVCVVLKSIQCIYSYSFISHFFSWVLVLFHLIFIFFILKKYK